MKREEIKAMLGEGAADEVVDKLLNAMHTEIEQHKKSGEDRTGRAGCQGRGDRRAVEEIDRR